MEQLKWEKVEQDHGGFLYRVKVPGGWLVRWTEDVCTSFTDSDHRYPYQYNLEWRSSICFLPDPEGAWLHEKEEVNKPTGMLDDLFLGNDYLGGGGSDYPY